MNTKGGKNKKGNKNRTNNKPKPESTKSNDDKKPIELDTAKTEWESQTQESPIKPDLKSDEPSSWESDSCIEQIDESLNKKMLIKESSDAGTSERIQKSKHNNVTRPQYDKPKVETTLDFNDYDKNYRKKKLNEYIHIEEKEQDLFEMPDDYSMAHCVAEDMNMGSGIAVNFRKKYGKEGELMDQRAKQGNVAILERDGRYVYYLVTKRESNLKPTYDSMFKSLCKLQQHMVEHKVTKLAIPRLGCGLDRLEWSEVKNMLEYVFTETDVKIVVCNFQKAEEVMQESVMNHRSRKCKVVSYFQPITNIDKFTLILYIGTEDKYVSPEMTMLQQKFQFLNDYKTKRGVLGESIETITRNQEYALYGCIAKKTKDSKFQYAQFYKCLFDINKVNVKRAKTGEMYEYVAVPHFNEDREDLFMAKITNLLRNTFYGVHVYICQGLNK